MAGWTKADYDDAYQIRVSRYFGGTGPGENEVILHYHKWGISPILASRWAKLQPILNILATDYVCVAGSGFGWGVEALIAESGATCVGVDISDYIATEITNTEETELRAEITAAGLDPDSGKGATMFASIYDAAPRGNIIFLQSDMSSQNERQLIRQALGGNWPSVVIYEDLFDDTWTDTELIAARNVGNGFGGAQRLICVYGETSTRSAQQLHDLMPASPSFEVITPDGLVYIP